MVTSYIELSDQGLVVKVPHCNVPVTETKFSLVGTKIYRNIIYLQQLKQTLESGLMARA